MTTISLKMKGISWSIAKRRNDAVDNKTPHRRLDKQTFAYPAEAAAPSVTWSYFLGNIFIVWNVKFFVFFNHHQVQA